MFEGFEELIILVVLALWILPWKGVALWRAAKRGEKKWFIALLVVNTIAILEIFYIFVISRKSQGGQKKGTDTFVKARAVIQKNKEEAKKKILRFLSQKGRIVNNDVEELLEVSDATATRYLERLERDGKIIQKGKRGSKVFYVQKVS